MMTSAEMPQWIDRVRNAAAGAELLEFLEKRLARPYHEGPLLDDRRGEGPEEVFEELAKEDAAFRERLDETIAQYFRSTAADPDSDLARPVIRGMLEIVQRRALAGTSAPLRAWLERYTLALGEGAGAQLGRAALGALATSQPQGLADLRDFWLRWWRSGPSAWQPRAFIGLRLQDPRAAAREIPELLARARAQKQDPGALLHGMWNQPAGRSALLDWLRKNEPEPLADEVRRALRKRIPDAEWPELGRSKPRRMLPTLAAPGDASWAP